MLYMKHFAVLSLALCGILTVCELPLAVAQSEVAVSPIQELLTAESLGKAISSLQKNYGKDYAQGADFQKELESLGQAPDAAKLRDLARRALTAHPLLAKNPILFVSRHQYAGDHHNTATLFQVNEINENKFNPTGEIKQLDLKTGEVKALFNPGKTGLARDPEMSFDGKKILFSCRKDIKDGYHIYEMDSDGRNVRQLTALPAVSDIDPMYLPEGDIIFSSSREPKFCMCNRHIMANLYRMGADGANPHQIGRSTLFEGHSSLLPDGRILYDRWEYVDRNFGDAQGLWTSNPDGTNHAIYWGNNTTSPGGVIDARPIPGTNKVIAVLAACHDRPWGAIGIIDRQKGLDGPVPVERTWPADYHSKISTTEFGYDSPAQFVKNRYEDPYPVDSQFFLVSRALDQKTKGEKTGLFLIDVFGNEILIHEESSGYGVYDAQLISSRPAPPSRPSSVDLKKKTGIFFLQNVYEGTHMKGVKPGEIKYLRIVESPEKRTWTTHGWAGQGEQAPAVNWHSFENKSVLGIVPVEKDGSACFEVPADKFVYFQALDADGKMVQSMRSGTIIRPGEYQSCVGCHEDRLSSPPADMGMAQASRRKPTPLTGRMGKTELFSYARDVQPIWDKNCLTCHDFGKKAGGKLNLAGDLIMPFNVSYTELWSKGVISCVGGGSAEIREPKSWGSSASRLVKVLEEGHNEVKLTPEEKATILTWLDLNGVYYPYYDTAYADGAFGQGPLNPEEYGKLQKLCGGILTGWHGSRGNVVISFTRPEISPILKKVEPQAATEILALLNEGKKRLEKTPRSDMPGFTPASNFTGQLDKYDNMDEMAQKVKAAMIAGKKVYDRDFVK